MQICILHILFLVALSLANPNKNGRIIGGQVAYPGQFGYSAAIYKTTSDGRYFCGGCLFLREWIITAGQCVYNATSFSIRLGATSLTSADDNTLLLAAETYFLHPDFNPATLENDIGLIQLREWVLYTDYIFPVNFLPTSALATYSLTETMGWGQTDDETSELSDELYWVSVNVLSNEECRLTYGNQITDSMVCVSGNYNEGSCIGDTGSPLIQEMGVGTYKLIVGVASFVSQNGCESTDPSGYTRIFSHVDWLWSIIQNDTLSNKN